MRRHLLLSVLTFAVYGCGSASEPVTTPPAIITFAFDGHPGDTMRVLVTNPQAIAAAQSYVATHRGPRLLSGQIVRGAGIDDRYPFQFLPETVALIDAAIELCDGAPMHTDAEVNAFFKSSLGEANAPIATWCPWSSYPIAVTGLGLD
jgi:hypothetical protein